MKGGRKALFSSSRPLLFSFFEKNENSRFSFTFFFLSFVFVPPCLNANMASSVSSPVLLEDAAAAAPDASTASAPSSVALLADATALAAAEGGGAAEALAAPATLGPILAAAALPAAAAAAATTANGLPIPRGLQDALRGLSREALRHQPEDVVEFSRWCVLRERGREGKGKREKTKGRGSEKNLKKVRLPFLAHLPPPHASFLCHNSYFADLQAAERAQREVQRAREALSAVAVSGGGGGESSGGGCGAATLAAASAAPLDADNAALVASCEEGTANPLEDSKPRDGDDASGALRAILGGGG